MGRWISYILMRMGGWRYIGPVPTEKKFVVISVPHTSMWDFVWGKFAFGSKRVQPIIFIKKESFFFPMGLLLKALGARPVDRGKGAIGLVEQVLDHFDKNEKFAVCITPEGTREKVTKWKRGFYYIAQKANVPIYLGIIDYGNKVMTIGERFMPTGDIDRDMQYFREYYKKHKPKPKHPEHFTFDFS
ncbi:MAG TPA: glycerol acyltransferase [Marinilabiliales bacterium]|nr:1-acyl-sn-glycerol-3-phosphate acyltransferase [Salinivirgaceae bacterium]OFX35822.1 MAG: hypothetical protein A2W95_04695 [Bacteroidetes bacterium GWA2_40_14]OFX60169.1 MAG: hypothetical protein A2W84_11335 [Bacteroidetes bacterium GWC2_40_13]OFX71011.1 MAG: hypothetical protein A2W96_11085 [Bacteroidetes bacterium GWD2_40_43]OFX92303.1 MAG: hypothetical protein A2W97_10065 [Bacteroidetes bacterium GWE2_40_63]OFY22906.1 MAG: hypothetical protein A2W88_04050 [Bacteroidetes bacterium GWF2_40